MNILKFAYHWDSRNLKKFITWILKSWAAQKIQKFNYCQDFRLEWKNIKKSEIKILLIYTDNEDKLFQATSKFSEIEKLQ